MALTKAQLREILSTAGVDSEKMSEAVDKIINGHTASIEALREERDNYKADAEKLPGVQRELDDLKAASNGDDWQEEYNTLKTEFDTYKADIAAEKETAIKKELFMGMLRDGNIGEAQISAIVKVTDFADKKFKVKDGRFENEEALKEGIKADWGAFELRTKTNGANVDMPPTTNGGAKLTKAEIYKKDDKGRYVMSTAERQKALAENFDIIARKE